MDLRPKLSKAEILNSANIQESSKPRSHRTAKRAPSDIDEKYSNETESNETNNTEEKPPKKGKTKKTKEPVAKVQFLIAFGARAVEDAGTKMVIISISIIVSIITILHPHYYYHLLSPSSIITTILIIIHHA